MWRCLSGNVRPVDEEGVGILGQYLKNTVNNLLYPELPAVPRFEYHPIDSTALIVCFISLGGFHYQLSPAANRWSSLKPHSVMRVILIHRFRPNLGVEPKMYKHPRHIHDNDVSQTMPVGEMRVRASGAETFGATGPSGALCSRLKLHCHDADRVLPSPVTLVERIFDRVPAPYFRHSRLTLADSG